MTVHVPGYPLTVDHARNSARVEIALHLGLRECQMFVDLGRVTSIAAEEQTEDGEESDQGSHASAAKVAGPIIPSSANPFEA